MDLDFAIEISVLNQRFYERLHKGFAFVSLLAGGSAFVTIFHPNSIVVTVAGLLVGILALLEQVYDFRGKATQHGALFKRFCRLKARTGGMTMTQVDAARVKLEGDSIPVIQGLRYPAFNNNLRSNGLGQYVKPLTRWERFLCFIVGARP